MKKSLLSCLFLLTFCFYISESVFSQGKCFFSQGVITGPQAVAMGTFGVIYSTTPVTNATSLVWTVPYGWVITSGQGTTTIIVTAGTTYGNIMFTGYNECGIIVAQRALLVIATNIPVSVSISSNPSGAVCSGTPVSFNAIPFNGGSSPVFQWRVNGANSGVNTSTFTYIPANNDAVNCKLTSSLQYTVNNPAASNTLNMTVNPLLPVSISIAPSSNPVCAGSLVTFIATATNGGTIPSYQWKVNGVNVGSNSATYGYTPSNNDAITCELTSNAVCPTGNPAISNTVTMIVNPNLPVSVSVGASANPVCSGIMVTCTATPVNGGLAPAYQWKVNGSNVGSNNATYSYSPSNNDAVTCIIISNAICPTGNPATSNTVTMTVNPLSPVNILISPSANPVCEGIPVTFAATTTNGGSTPFYQWKVNGINAGSNTSSYTYTPVNNDAVTCVFTSTATCPTGNPAISNTVTMTVNPLLPVSISVVPSSNPVCAGTLVTFTATPANGGSAPVYQWKVNGINQGSNSSTYSYTPFNNDAITCELTSNAVCPTGNPAASNTVTMTVTPLLPVSVSISANQNPVCQNSLVILTAFPVNGGSTSSYQWNVNEINISNNAPVYFYSPANNDKIKCILTSNANCVTGNPATSNTVTMTVTPMSFPQISIEANANSVCTGTVVNFYIHFIIAGGTSPVYQWQVNGTNVGTNTTSYSYAPANGDAVKCALYSNAPCPQSYPVYSNTINMTVNPNLPVSVSISDDANPVCASTTVNFTATPTNGGSSPSYQWKVNGVNVGTNSPTYSYAPANNNTVTCMLTSNATCAAGSPAASNTVTMTVNPFLPVSVSISPSSYPICQGTFTATPVNGGSTPSYQWKVNGVNAGTNTQTYIYSPSNNNTVSCILTSNAACPTGNPATSNTVTISITFTINHVAGDVAPVDKTVTYGTVTNVPGIATKCFITSNLGADQQATAKDDATEASAGWYWQFNRKQGYKHDGTIRTPNSTWITSFWEYYDWQPANDPCSLELGSGWRIPTYTEWGIVSYGWPNWDGPWNSALKMHAAGYLDGTDGSLQYRGSVGHYWSSWYFSYYQSRDLYFNSTFFNNNQWDDKRYGFTLRCLRD